MVELAETTVLYPNSENIVDRRASIEGRGDGRVNPRNVFKLQATRRLSPTTTIYVLRRKLLAARETL